jgi:hypothetical protein
MKTPTYIITIVLLSGLVNGSCNNDEDPTDFRDKYIGKYQVHETISSYGTTGFTEPYSKEKDTVISVNYGATDSTINVLGRDVRLDSTGSYSAYHYFLRLWNDSISSSFMNGGLGFGQKEIYLGFRISNTP